MLLYLLNLTVTIARGSPRLSFFSLHGIAGAVSFSSFRTVQEQCHRSIPRGFLCCGVLFAVWHFLLPILQSIFLLVLGKSDPSFRLKTVWSGIVFWIFVGLPLTHSLLRRIWNLAVPVHSSERVTSFASAHESIDKIFTDIVFTRLKWSHDVDVFQWDRTCFIIWVVKHQTGLLMMSTKNFSTHRARIFCCSSSRTKNIAPEFSSQRLLTKLTYS